MILKNLIYHMNLVSPPGDRNFISVFASEIYHCSNWLKIDRKTEKYLMR